MSRRLAALALILSCTGACELPSLVQVDAGSRPLDSGVNDADAGTSDAGSQNSDAGVDAGDSDAGREIRDAGVDAGSIDAGFAADAAIDDAGTAGDAGVDAGATRDAGTPCSRCSSYAPSAVNRGPVATQALREISGIAVSRLHPNVFYAHNDSGGAASLYAFSSAGASLAELQLTNAVNFDWEDLTIGPCPSGSCLYVGDIGVNGSNRPPIYVYRIAEPTTPPSGTLPVTSERFELQYPQGALFDCETLMVHPQTGDLYLVTKRPLGQKSAVYKASAPLSATAPNVMTKVADLAVPDGADLPLTGGDIDPCGTNVVLRSYSAVYQFSGSGGAFDSVFTTPFTKLPAPPLALSAAGELQGEAITWLPGGGYLTVSEGASPMMHAVLCR